MYRSTRQRAQRAGTWALSVVAAVVVGVGAASLVPHTTHATAGAPAASAVPSPASATLNAARGTAQIATIASTGPIAVNADTVAALTGTSITVRTANGATLRYALNATTTVLQGHARVSVASLRVGERVFVVPSATSATLAGTIGILSSGESEGSGGESSH